MQRTQTTGQVQRAAHRRDPLDHGLQAQYAWLVKVLGLQADAVVLDLQLESLWVCGVHHHMHELRIGVCQHIAQTLARDSKGAIGHSLCKLCQCSLVTQTLKFDVQRALRAARLDQLFHRRVQAEQVQRARAQCLHRMGGVGHRRPNAGYGAGQVRQRLGGRASGSAGQLQVYLRRRKVLLHLLVQRMRQAGALALVGLCTPPVRRTCTEQVRHGDRRVAGAIAEAIADRAITEDCDLNTADA